MKRLLTSVGIAVTIAILCASAVLAHRGSGRVEDDSEQQEVMTDFLI